MRSRFDHAVTLTEVMVVVAIAAIIAAVAIPQFGRWIRRAKTAEVLQSLERISAGARTYYQVALTDTEGRPLARQFPSATPVTPAAACCDFAGDICSATAWTHPTWRALSFSISTPHYYQYQWQGSVGVALGNLDCDTVTATWQTTCSTATQPPECSKPSPVPSPLVEIE